MKKLETTFTYQVSPGHKIEVRAKAGRVTGSSAKKLELELFTLDGEEYDMVLDEETNLDLEETAIQELYVRKYEV